MIIIDYHHTITYPTYPDNWMVNNPSSWVIHGWFTIPFWAKTDGTRRRHRGKRGTRWIRARHVGAKKEAAAVNVAAVKG